MYVTEVIMKEMLYMKCGVLKSNEDMILALAGSNNAAYG